MGTVYVGRLTSVGGFERKVAVKVIHAHLGRERPFIEMFLDEARIAARVHHPNVCQVFDFGEDSGRHYLAMEYLDGSSFKEILHRSSQIPPSQMHPFFAFVAAVIGGVAEGLHAAHQLEIVHRDVSPSNIVVTQAGIPKIVDFGIATTKDRIHHTAHGTMKGNFAYCAPEHLKGAKVDARADVWSLGVVAWEAHAGRSLFRQPSASETIRAVEQASIPRLVNLNPSIPSAIDAVIVRALQRDPSLRYPTARAFGEAYGQAASTYWGVAGPETMSRWLRGTLKEPPAPPSQTDTSTRATLSESGTTRRWPLVLAALAMGGLGFAGGKLLKSALIPHPETAAATTPAPTSKSNTSKGSSSSPPAPDPAPAKPDAKAEPSTAPPPPPPPDARHSTASRRRSRPAKRQRKPPPAGRGELQLVTTGVSSAPVYVDGRLLAWSPLVEPLAVGQHTLELRPAGRRPKKVKVTIKRDQPTRVVVNFDP